MKPIQVMIDEKLLVALDADGDVEREGRSAVIRRIVADYLRRKQASAIDEEYRRGYGQSAGLGRGWEGWEEQGAWPED